MTPFGMTRREMLTRCGVGMGLVGLTQLMGDAGLLSVAARGAVDPAHPRNKEIIDLALAPRNADGKVEFESDFFLLAPKDPGRGNGAIFYDVNNRGNKLALRFFNRSGGGNNPVSEKDAGAPTLVQLSIEFRNMQQWQEMRRMIAGIRGVGDLDVIGLSARSAEITLSFPGGEEALAERLTAQGLHVDKLKGTLLVRPAI